jgi:predicted DNA binding CopG/RHH family protein
VKKKVPQLKTDKQAEAFLAQDLCGLDFSQFKGRAKARGIPCSFIRETLERAIAPK